MQASRMVNELTKQLLAYLIIRRDGLPSRDEHSNDFTFSSRAETES
jgi:hypothetical protein